MLTRSYIFLCNATNDVVDNFQICACDLQCCDMWFIAEHSFCMVCATYMLNYLTGSCYSTTLCDKHSCVENSMRHNCPICYEVCVHTDLLCSRKKMEISYKSSCFAVSFWIIERDKGSKLWTPPSIWNVLMRCWNMHSISLRTLFCHLL